MHHCLIRQVHCQRREKEVPLVLLFLPLGKSIYKWGKTNLFHNGLNPAHVPFLKVNNLNLFPCCEESIRRADIEGSKSNVDMSSWLPQASYPCGNFSDTSRYNNSRLEGSLGLAFTACTGTGCTSQNSFYPYVLRNVSVVSELLFGHVGYCFRHVPPQPNSLQINVDCLNRQKALIQKAHRVLVCGNFTSQSK